MTEIPNTLFLSRGKILLTEETQAGATELKAGRLDEVTVSGDDRELADQPQVKVGRQHRVRAAGRLRLGLRGWPGLRIRR